MIEWKNERKGVFMMEQQLSDETMKYIIARLVVNANEAITESEADKEDLFKSGRRLAYYEMLDILKSEIDARGLDLKEFGLAIDVNHFA